MKFNKWTLGLAAVGAVSLASAARADEARLSQVQTALSDTTISGYVSTSVNWQQRNDVAVPGNSRPSGFIPLQNGKANGFNLDVVKLSIARPQDDSLWAAGYQVDLLFGPDAVGWNPSVTGNSDSQFAIQQAFLALRTPVGTGIDWKVGVFNTIVGYESFDAVNDPNYTRSWAWAVQPSEHTGILGTYHFNSEWAISGGVANTLSAGINNRNTYKDNFGNVWHKAVMGSLTFNAPNTWGWASGSAFYAGAVYGFAGGQEGLGGTQAGNQMNLYAGATLNSPWKNVTFGATFDYVQNLRGQEVFIGPNGGLHADDYIVGLYNTIKATDKLSFNTRGEFWEIDGKDSHSQGSNGGFSLTETVQYDLWANVIARLEFRWDHFTSQSPVGYVLPTLATVDNRSSYGFYANFIYKF